MIAVVDYAMGNLRSVCHALSEAAGAEPVRLTAAPAELADASHIVLPGVGNFRAGMKTLAERGLDEALVRLVRDEGRPFLGICLGMQLLAETGEEDGASPGLGILPGRTRRIRAEGLPVPHIGWDDVTLTEAAGPIPRELSGTDFYFVHSYVFDAPGDLVAGWCTYGERFPAAVCRDNVLGVQFHPEKSRRPGLDLLRSFLQGKACSRSAWFLPCC
ncbi:MAG: imidazole glycerol phosphate synthase subunit HisH [Desulfovibrionaceae bacterium]